MSEDILALTIGIFPHRLNDQALHKIYYLKKIYNDVYKNMQNKDALKIFLFKVEEILNYLITNDVELTLKQEIIDQYIDLIYDISIRIVNIGGLIWFSNSCYIDTMLMAMFAYPNKSILKNILYTNPYRLLFLDPPKCMIDKEKKTSVVWEDFLKDVKKIQEDFQILKWNLTYSEVKFKCVNLRNTLIHCSPYDNRKQDQFIEFWKYIFNDIFNMPGAIIYITFKYFNPKSFTLEKYQRDLSIYGNRKNLLKYVEYEWYLNNKDKIINNNNRVDLYKDQNKYIYVDFNQTYYGPILLLYIPLNIQNTWKITKSDMDYFSGKFEIKRDVTRETICPFYADFFVLDIIRNPAKLINVIPLLQVELFNISYKKNIEYILTSIIMYKKTTEKSGHFTSIFKENNKKSHYKWYFYDDLEKGKIKAGFFEKLFKENEINIKGHYYIYSISSP